MATSFKFYKNAALTELFVLGTDYIGPVTSPPDDSLIIWFGSTDATKKLQAASPGTPGTTPVYVTIEDAASGSGLEATDVKLADTYAGLSSATGGADLSLTATVLGGVSNAAEIYIEVDFAAGGIASDKNVSLNVLGDEYAV